MFTRVTFTSLAAAAFLRRNIPDLRRTRYGNNLTDNCVMSQIRFRWVSLPISPSIIPSCVREIVTRVTAGIQLAAVELAATVTRVKIQIKPADKSVTFRN